MSRDGWTEIAPGCWRSDDPIDEKEVRALMDQRLAARGYRLRHRKPSLRVRIAGRLRTAR